MILLGLIVLVLLAAIAIILEEDIEDRDK